MAAYVDYTYYTDEYKGAAIPDTEFDRLALRASEVTDNITFRRARKAAGVELESVKLAVCAVAEVLQDIDQSGAGAGVLSERVGGHTVTYAATARADQHRAVYAAAAKYLDWTGMLYAGVAT